MGILNLTPDSFYDSNKDFNLTFFQKKIDLLKKADMIDVGAESSKPGSKPISEEQEIERLQILFKLDLHNKLLSIDSYKPKVIKYCLDNGFAMINDISGGGNNFINIDIAKDYNVPICLMHMQGNPYTMQDNPSYDNIIDDIVKYFKKRIDYCMKIEYDLSKLIIDPGIGFGKIKEDNYKIISNICKFKDIGCKVLIGVSRKSFLQINDNMPEDRLSSSLAVQSICAYKGVDIIRTHDVEEVNDCLQVISNFIK